MSNLIKHSVTEKQRKAYYLDIRHCKSIESTFQFCLVILFLTLSLFLFTPQCFIIAKCFNAKKITSWYYSFWDRMQMKWLWKWCLVCVFTYFMFSSIETKNPFYKWYQAICTYRYVQHYLQQNIPAVLFVH